MGKANRYIEDILFFEISRRSASKYEIIINFVMDISLYQGI